MQQGKAQKEISFFCLFVTDSGDRGKGAFGFISTFVRMTEQTAEISTKVMNSKFCEQRYSGRGGSLFQATTR